MNQVIEIEELWFRALNDQAGKIPALDQLMILASRSETWLLVGVCLLTFFIWKKNRPMLVLMIIALVAMGLSDFISFEYVKHWVKRDRPCWILSDVHAVLGYCGGSYGFTSNHAANSFAVWFTVARHKGVRSKISLFVLFFALLVSISRVYLGVHFWGDILGGALLGICVAECLFRAKLFQKMTRS